MSVSFGRGAPAFKGATVFLTTSSVALTSGSFTDVINTGAIGAAGDYLYLSFSIMGTKSDGQAFFEGAIWNGSAYVVAAEGVNSAATQTVCIGNGVVVGPLSGPTTFTLRCRPSAINCSALRTSASTSVNDKLTAISWFKVG